jgi:DICT domain-containing protein
MSERTLSTTPSAVDSVYLAVRRGFTDLASVRLRKRVLMALSCSVEREILTRAQHPVLFGAFQRERFFRQAWPRWRELALRSRAAVIFAEEFVDGRDRDGVVRLPVPEDAPLRLEWAIVCDDPGLCVVLSGWEIPGQEAVADSERLFEVVWSFEPAPVRVAALTCARLAGAAPGQTPLADQLQAAYAPPDLRQVSNLLAGVLGSIDDDTEPRRRA